MNPSPGPEAERTALVVWPLRKDLGGSAKLPLIPADGSAGLNLLGILPGARSVTKQKKAERTVGSQLFVMSSLHRMEVIDESWKFGL